MIVSFNIISCFRAKIYHSQIRYVTLKKAPKQKLPSPYTTLSCLSKRMHHKSDNILAQVLSWWTQFPIKIQKINIKVEKWWYKHTQNRTRLSYHKIKILSPSFDTFLSEVLMLKCTKYKMFYKKMSNFSNYLYLYEMLIEKATNSTKKEKNLWKKL